MPTTFRVFVSSTFDDFHAERAALQPVFARLSAYCEARGTKFQAIDLRWGISEEAAREQRTLDLCLKEIARCRQLSPRPNFLCLLGDRYGWRPLPPRLRPAEIERLAPSAPERFLLEHWYRLDAHAREAEHVLTRGEADEAEWEAACARMREIFTAALVAVPAAAPLAARVERSATHHEIAAGILGDTAAREQALAYERAIPDLDASEAAVRRYRDHEPPGLFATPAAEALDGLKAELRERLGPRYRRLETTLVADEPDPAYLGALATDAEASLRAVIDQELERREKRSAVEVERAAHALFAEERGEILIGRGAELERLRRYVLEPSGAAGPLLVTGEGGVGKSALLARAARSLAGEEEVTVVTRFVGASAETTRPEALFGGVIAELRARSGAAPREEVLEVAGAAHFVAALAEATAERRVALLIDGLDQVRFERARDVTSWIPQRLPPNLRLIVAARPGPVRDVLSSRAGADAELTLAPFDPAQAIACLDAMLAGAGRCVAGGHRERALERLQAGARPLEVRLIATRLEGLRSFEPPRKLGYDLPSAVDALLDELMDPREHLPALVRCALTLLAAARDGIADDEMQALLALDPAVVQAFAVSTRHRWDLARGLPPILWSRLFDALSPYLMQREVDGQPQLAFFHREFEERVRERLLAEPAAVRAAHGLLADYFDGPLAADAYREAAAGNPRLVRRVNVVAEHLWRSGRHARWVEVLTDFGFLMARCATGRPGSLRLDLALATPTPAEARDHVGFLRETLGLLDGAGRAWPAFKILLQRAMEQPESRPVRRSAEAWLDQDACDWVWLRDVRAASTPPERGVNRLAGHEGGVRGVAGAPDGTRVSWGADGVLRVLDRASGVVLDVLEGHSGPVLGALVEAERIVSWSAGEIIAWVPATGERRASFAVEGRDLHEVHALSGGEVLALFQGGAIQRLELASGASGPRLSLGADGETRPGARSFEPGLRHGADGEVAVRAGGQLAVWQLEAGTLLDGWSLHHPGFRTGASATNLVWAGWSDRGDLLAADDCGRLFRRSADRSSFEVRWGAASPFYWEDPPYHGGSTVLADERVLLWQAYLVTRETGTSVRRVWTVWDPRSDTRLAGGETLSEELASGTSEFMDLLTQASMHAYPLLALSETRLVGCHGRLLTLVDLEAGDERIIRRTGRVVWPPAAVVLDPATIALADDDQALLVRLAGGEHAQRRIARGEGRPVCGVASAPGRYLLGMEGGSLLEVELGDDARPASAGAAPAERDYQLAVSLPGGRFAALDPSPAAEGEVDLFDLQDGVYLDTLVAHRFDLEGAGPQSRRVFESLLQTETGRSLAASFDQAYDLRVVSGLLCTLGFDGLKLWDDRRPEPLLQIDLSASLGCRRMYPFWLEADGGYTPARAEAEPPGGELAILAQTQSGDTVLVRAMQGALTVLDGGRMSDPGLGHAHHKGLEVLADRWLIGWYGIKAPRLWDLQELLRTGSPEPVTVFEALPAMPLLDARMRQLVEASPELHRPVTLGAFAEVRATEALPGQRYAFLRAGGDCLIFSRAGARVSAFRADQLSPLDGERCAAWLTGHPDRGADRRYRVHRLETGTVLATSPRHDADLEGVAQLDDGSLLSWTQSGRFWRWSPGEAGFREVVRVRDAAPEHADWLRLRAGAAPAGLFLGPGHWFAWSAGDAVGLSEAGSGNGPGTLLWQDTEPARVHHVDAGGSLLATTASGRLLVLQLHHGRERIDFAALVAGAREDLLPLFRGAVEARRAAGLRAKALALCHFDRRDDAEALLDAAQEVFEQDELPVDLHELLQHARAQLRLAWSQGDRERIHEVAEDLLGFDAETAPPQLQDSVRLLRLEAAQSHAAIAAIAGRIEEGLEVLLAELARHDDAVLARPPADRAALLVHLIDQFGAHGWLSSPDAVLLAREASLAAKRAIVAALHEDRNSPLVVQAVHETAHAARQAGDLERTRRYLDELEACLHARHEQAVEAEGRRAAAGNLADVAHLRARMLAELGAADEALTAFDAAYTRRRALLADPDSQPNALDALLQMLGSWVQLELGADEPGRARFLGFLIVRDLLTRAREEVDTPREIPDIPLEELVAARDALRPLADLDAEPSAEAAQRWGFVLETAEFVAAHVARMCGFAPEDLDLVLRFNEAVAELHARAGLAEGLAVRQRALGLLVQALDEGAPGEVPRLLGEAAARTVVGLLDLSQLEEANRIAVAVSQRLKRRAVAGDRAAALALNTLMGKLTDAFEERGHLESARATCFGHAMFLREIVETPQGASFHDDWAAIAARSIALVARDLGFEDAARLAGHWHHHAVEDLRTHPGEHWAGDWLTILLAEDALYAAHEQNAPPQLRAGLRAIAGMSAEILADFGSRAPAGVSFEFERAALAWLGLALRERDREQSAEALDLLVRTCAGVLPVERWQSHRGLEQVLLRLRASAATLPATSWQEILERRASQRDALRALLGLRVP
jgi:hypothetical protein